METSYKVSEGIHDLFMRSHALRIMAKQTDDEEKGIKLIADGLRVQKNAWEMVYAEHPEIDRNKKWSYSVADMAVTLEEKEYTITEEIREMFEKALLEDQMRDAILKNAFFIFRLPVAAMHNKRSRDYTQKAWDMVEEMYPETVGVQMGWGSRRALTVHTQ